MGVTMDELLGTGGDDKSEDTTDTENVCGDYLEHTEPNGFGCCKRCDAQLDTDDGDDPPETQP